MSAYDKKPKEEPMPPSRVKVKGEVTKKKTGLGKKLRAVFFEEDAKSTGKKLVGDVLVPAAKDLLYDLITKGAGIGIYGESSSRKGKRGESKSSYTSYYKSDTRERERDRARRVNPVTIDLNEYGFEIEDDAQSLLDMLRRDIRDNGEALVTSFFDSIGETPNTEYTIADYGWDDIDDIPRKPSFSKGLWYLDLPRPKRLR